MSELKNPTFWGFVSLLGGMILGGWGWDKYESTIATRTHGSVAMMIMGCVMIVGGLLTFYIVSNTNNRNK